MSNIIEKINEMQIELDLIKLNLNTAIFLGLTTSSDHRMKEARKKYESKVDEFNRKVKELKYKLN
jgi:hypothetical protein